MLFEKAVSIELLDIININHLNEDKKIIKDSMDFKIMLNSEMYGAVLNIMFLSSKRG